MKSGHRTAEMTGEGILKVMLGFPLEKFLAKAE